MIHRYVYYHCTGGRDRKCKQPYIREEELLDQICQIIDQIDVAMLNNQKHLQEEIARYERFTREILGQQIGLEHKNKVDLKDYTKYVLKEGTREEKRELLGCLKVRLLLNNRVVYIEK